MSSGQTGAPPPGSGQQQQRAGGGRADVSSSSQRFKSGAQGREPLKLVAMFVAMLATAPVLGWMMGRAWVPEHSLYSTVQSSATQLLGLGGEASVELIGVFGVGAYLALLLLFTFDMKKRVQGALLLVGTGIALGVIASMGVFIPRVNVTAINAIGLVLGVAAGLFIESGQLLALDLGESSLRRPTLDSGEVAEFRYASVLLFVLLTGMLLVTFVQAIQAGVVRVFDAAAVLVFVGMTYQFIQYDAEADYMTLGPARSGKSMMMLGLCLDLMQHSDHRPNPNEYLQSGLERASNLRRGEERWPIPSTAHDDIQVASFEVISGRYFPRRLELQALDYAGQHLSRVADVVAGRAGNEPADSIPRKVATWVEDADTLLVILDVERLVYPGAFQEEGVTDRQNVSWGLEYYGTILEETTHDDVVVVATKCDILIDQGYVATPSEYQSFEAFREAITEYLGSRPDVTELFGLANESEIHPVYFQTKVQDREYVPALDDRNNLIPVGYAELVDELSARQ